MLVMKFGGTSVGDASCFGQAAAIVARNLDSTPVVVVSAMSGVTNHLLALARQAQTGDAAVTGEPVASLLQRHLDVIDAVVTAPKEATSAKAALARFGSDLASILTGVCLVREATPRTLDAVAAFGEKMSASILAAALRSAGSPARYVSAEDLVLTDDNHGQAVPVQPATDRLICRRLLPMIRKGRLPVVTGFIARSLSGATTTLSRGGSDYSASLLGAALGAREIWIWTDVDGVMTADPRAIPEAHTVSVLSYAEAAELSYFGAKVLHPKTVAPAVRRGIPIWIKNTFRPDAAGTLIRASPPAAASTAQNGVVKAITSMPGMSLVTVQGAGMIGVPGIAARVFAAVAATGASVMMISQSSSEYNICFVVGRDSSARVLQALRREFAGELTSSDISDLWTQDVAVLAVVGEGMRGTPGVAGRLFCALGSSQINVIAIAQGSSELNISFVVDEAQRLAALRCIHHEFISGKEIQP